MAVNQRTAIGECVGMYTGRLWERNGYHMYGHPWKEQRHSKDR